MSQQQQSIQSPQNGQIKTHGPNPEVVPPVQHRRFSAAYKQRILAEADRCTQAGEVGALLRREGLYSSHLTRWRQQLQTAQLERLQPRQRGRKADPQAAEMARLQRENERLKSQLDRAELIIEAQKNFVNYSTCRLIRTTSPNDDHR